VRARPARRGARRGTGARGRLHPRAAPPRQGGGQVARPVGAPAAPPAQWLPPAGPAPPRRGGRHLRSPRRAGRAGRWDRRAGRSAPPAGPGGRPGPVASSPPASRHYGFGELAQDPVHEPARLLAAESLGQPDRLVDRGSDRDLASYGDLVHGHSQDDPIHAAHLVDLPVGGGRLDGAVQLRAVLRDAPNQLLGEFHDGAGGLLLSRLVSQCLDRVVTRAVLQLEEDLQRQLPRTVARSPRHALGGALGPHPYVANAMLETKTLTSATSRPSIRWTASMTLSCTLSATSRRTASASTVRNTSRWILCSASRTTRTPRCAVSRLIQSPK